jgi:hypothetical protein
MKKQLKKLSLNKKTIANLNSNLDSLRINALLGGAAVPTTTASDACHTALVSACDVTTCKFTHKKHHCNF